MGCASSTPLVDGGKNLMETAKDTATDTIAKGGKAIQGIGETVQNAFTSAEQTVENAAEKIGETFNFKNSQIKDVDVVSNNAAAINENVPVLASKTKMAKIALTTRQPPVYETLNPFEESMEKTVNKAQDTITTDVEEKITEIENKTNELKDKAEEIKEEVKEITTETIEKIDTEVKELKDDVAEHFDMMGDNVQNVKEKAEELVKDEHEEVKKSEEASPTFWEAAHDAILLKKSLKQFEELVGDKERIFFTNEHDKSTVDKGPQVNSNDLILENTEDENQ